MTAPLGPRLVRPGDAASGPPAPTSVTTRTGGRWLLPLALAAALVGAAAWGVEARRARALEAEVTALATSLRAAEAEVAAYRGHLDAIRGGVAGVRERLDALQALAARDPAPKGPTRGAPSEGGDR